MLWWQLLWLLHDNIEYFQTVLAAPECAQYRQWFQDRERIRLTQRREILDAIVPDELCLKALAGCRDRFVVENGNLYGGFPGSRTDMLTAVEVYKRYGGMELVDSIDRGVAPVTERTLGETA